jgi:hypothetical protein
MVPILKDDPGTLGGDVASVQKFDDATDRTVEEAERRRPLELSFRSPLVNQKIGLLDPSSQTWRLHARDAGGKKSFVSSSAL